METTRPPRLIWPDLARTVALVGMAAYHLTWDLAMFGFVPVRVLYEPGFMAFARTVAGSFLFLAGVSLWLAHRHGFRRRAFLVRLAQVAAGAVAVSVATVVAMPEAFIFYGILHSIAVASVVGLLFLRLPGWVALAGAVAAFLVPAFISSPVFDPPWLAWTGLFETIPRSVDFEPLFPWVGPFLAGLGVAKLLDGAGLLTARGGHDRLRAHGWPGRHSLLIYLLHQPILFGGVWLARQVI